MAKIIDFNLRSVLADLPYQETEQNEMHSYKMSNEVWQGKVTVIAYNSNEACEIKALALDQLRKIA